MVGRRNTLALGGGVMGAAGEAERGWVVLVEEDQALQKQLAGAIERALPGVSVRGTADADHALGLARDQRSRLLITEAQSATVDGLVLAAAIRQQRPALPLIFLGGRELNGTSTQFAALGSSHLVHKPPHIERFVGLVAHLLDPAPGFRGEMASSDLCELVQLVAMTTPIGAMHIVAPEGHGTIWLEQGTVVHAVGDGEHGVTAFRRMMRWSSGQFRLEPDAVAPERAINFSTTQLLLESARLFDEEQAGRAARGEAGSTNGESGIVVVGEPLPREQVKRSLDSAFVANDRPALGLFGGETDSGRAESGMMRMRAPEHFQRGLEAVQERRYAEALAHWEHAAALEPGNRLYQHNLRRLRHRIDVDSLGLPGGGGDE